MGVGDNHPAALLIEALDGYQKFTAGRIGVLEEARGDFAARRLAAAREVMTLIDRLRDDALTVLERRS